MRIVVLDDYQQVAESLVDWKQLVAEVVVALRERTPFTAARFAQLPELKLLVTTGRVNASIDLDAAKSQGILVCGTESTITATPQLTWGLILSVLRRIPLEDAAMRTGGWQSTVGGDLFWHRLGVVGLGRLGTQVARVGAAFGMDVVAWSQNLEQERAADVGAHAVSKEELFATSDVVTVHYKLIGALESGQIRGAGLDVYDEEPLPHQHPLRSAPRTVLTPHLGYVTEDTYRIFFAQALEDIVAWMAGEPVRVLG